MYIGKALSAPIGKKALLAMHASSTGEAHNANEIMTHQLLMRTEGPGELYLEAWKVFTRSSQEASLGGLGSVPMSMY